MEQNNQAPAPSPRAILTLNEAAQYLRISKSQMIRLLQGRFGPAPQHKRAGNRILIRQEWLDEWLERAA